MKTVDVDHRSRVLNGLLRQAQEENLVLRAPDGREFVLAEIFDRLRLNRLFDIVSSEQHNAMCA